MSFISEFLNPGKKDIARGKAEATGELNSAEAKARGDYGGAISRFDTYAAGGAAGQKDYLASLGLLGPEEQNRVEQTYLNDPIQNALMDRIQRGNNRSYGAIGFGNSGKSTQSLTNALLASWKARQDQLKGVSDQGFQATGAQAGLQAGMGDLSFGAGQQRAGVDIGAANANAASKAAGINNILGAGGTFAKIMAAV